MGFLKKKPSVKLPNGSELARAQSTKSSLAGSPPAAPSTSSLPLTIDEARDDGGAVERTDEATNSKAEAPSRARASTAPSVNRESRDKPPSRSSSGAQSSSKPKKKHSSSGGGAGGGKSSRPAKDGKERKSRSSGAGAKGDGKERRSRQRTVSPVTLGFKKTPGSEKKKHTRHRSRSASAGQGKRRGRSVTPTTPKAKGEGSNNSKAELLAMKKTASNNKLSSSTKTKMTGNTKTTKSQVIGGRNKKSRSASRSASRPNTRPASAPTTPAPSKGGKSGIKKKLEQLSVDDSSYCSSGSESSYDSSCYETDEYTTEMEDSTMYTDESNSFVSLGYNTTQDSADYSRVSGSSSGETDASDETGEEGMEVSPRSFRSRDTKGFSTSFEDSKQSRSVRGGGLGGKLFSKKATDSLSALVAHAEKASKNEKTKDGNADEVSSPSSTAAEAHGGGDETLTTKEDASSKAASSTNAPSAVSGATYADFMEKMEGFVVKDPDHQLVIQVTEHGNVEKLTLQELSYVPKPNKPNEIVIKVDASTITLQDCMIRRGKWYEMQTLPFVPGSDFVGIISEMGDEASKNSTFQVGDKVAAVVPSGGNAKYITMPYQNIIRVPNEADSVVALCLSSTYVPAREALDLARKLNTPFTGANILVIGGNGPSGLATIELALLEGANVFTTADERHHEYLSNLGAKCFPIDPDKWLPTLQGKMDVVLDSVCLDGYDSSSLALNPAGTLVCTGMSAVYTQGQIRAFGMRDVRDYKAAYCKMRAKYLLNNALYYDRVERYEFAPNEYAQHFRYLCHLASNDTITPLVSSRTPLNLVAATQKAIEHGDTTYGVCVCTPWTTNTPNLETSSSC